MKKLLLTGFVLVLVSCGFNKRQDFGRFEDHLILSIQENSLNPADYVISRFENHDVIFIGENHYIKEQVEFVKELIPELYKNGIYCLGTEFIRHSDTELINRLITDSIYDNRLAEQVTFNSSWHWGYREYLDIYKTAWKLNKNLPEGAPKFVIFGIEEDMDWSYVNSEEDMNNPEIMMKVFKSSNEFEEEEGFSAYTIQKEVIDKDQKALIHCGIHHGFTSYHQPRFDEEKQQFSGYYNNERMGNLIKNKLGDKTITIFLHGPWYWDKGYDKQVLPVEGILDSIFSVFENRKYMPFGMDTNGTLFGELKGENSIYRHGYPDFMLKDFCDGYIFLKPVNEYRVVTTIKDFVKPENVEHIRQQELRFRNENLTADDLNDTIKNWLNNFQAELKLMNN